MQYKIVQGGLSVLQINIETSTKWDLNVECQAFIIPIS